MAEENKQYYCEKCNRTMGADQFYSSNNLEKYPNDGKFPMCKKCMTMHVDNWNPDTYMWILQEADVPYVPEEWDKLMAKYAKDNRKMTGMTIIGRYLSKMKLKQFCDYRWKHTEFLQELARKKREQVMKQQGYDAEQIALANERAAFAVPQNLEIPDLKKPETNPFLATGQEDYFAEQSGSVEDEIDLTDEDRIYLRLKWGKTYKPEEWVRLEQLYNDMMNSYDIQGAGHEDNLKLLCKTSLKANQLIDIGDVEGFQKMSKVYDTLMKSGKFSAAQNKAESGEYIDSVGELVAICEKDGFIPRYYLGEPNDKVDQTILDMKRYTRTLITEETNLGNLIEEAIKNNQKEDEAAAAADQDVDTGLLDDIEEIEQQLKDDDFEEYSEFLDNEEASDADLLEFLSKEGR